MKAYLLTNLLTPAPQRPTRLSPSDLSYTVIITQIAIRFFVYCGGVRSACLGAVGRSKQVGAHAGGKGDGQWKDKDDDQMST